MKLPLEHSRWLDRWGRVWELFYDENGDPVMFNSQQGAGLWNDGDGLKLLDPYNE